MSAKSYSILVLHYKPGGNDEEVAARENSYRKEEYLVAHLVRWHYIIGKKCKEDYGNDEMTRKIPGQEKYHAETGGRK